MLGPFFASRLDIELYNHSRPGHQYFWKVADLVGDFLSRRRRPLLLLRHAESHIGKFAGFTGSNVSKSSKASDIVPVFQVRTWILRLNEITFLYLFCDVAMLSSGGSASVR